MGVCMQDWKFKSSNYPPVTVIVPMRNQEHNLSRLVANLRSQTVRDAQFLLPIIHFKRLRNSSMGTGDLRFTEKNTLGQALRAITV